jgi:hypothetical protein
VVILLISWPVVAIKFCSEDLKEFVMAQVNDHIDATVEVEEISVRVFQNFPRTSIVMEQITVGSSHHFNAHDFNESGADTLFTAEMASLSFNLSGMIRGKFRIKKIEISNGSLHSSQFSGESTIR